MIQNCGVYLGTGFGRKQFRDPKRNQHWSDGQEFIFTGSQQKYISTYHSGYKLRRLLEEGSTKGRCSSAIVTAPTAPSLNHSSSKDQGKAMRRCFSSILESRKPPAPSLTAVKVRQVPEKPHSQTVGTTKSNMRRFPHKYSLPKDMEGARPSVNTLWWHSNREGVGKLEPEASFGVPRTAAFIGAPGNSSSLSLLAATQPLPKSNTWKY